jgi:hypothetical protein
VGTGSGSGAGGVGVGVGSGGAGAGGVGAGVTADTRRSTSIVMFDVRVTLRVCESYAFALARIENVPSSTSPNV